MPSTSAASSALRLAMLTCTGSRVDRGAVHERAGELEREPGVREMVLHRLERTDGHAELLALLHVVDGQFQHAVGEPALLRGGAEHAAVERGGESPATGCGVPVTSNSRRAPSTDACGVSVAVAGSNRPAAVKTTSAVSAQGTSACAPATTTVGSPSSGTPAAAVSTIGSGTA